MISYQVSVGRQRFMTEKLEVTTSESAFQLHLLSVVINVCNDVNTYLGKKSQRRVMLHKNHNQWCMLMYNGVCCIVCSIKECIFA